MIILFESNLTSLSLRGIKNENPENPLLPLHKRPELCPRILRRTPRYPEAMSFEIPQIGLELAQIRDILLIAGSEEALKTFRSTQATILIDSLDEFRAYLKEEEQKSSGGRIRFRPAGDRSRKCKRKMTLHGNTVPSFPPENLISFSNQFTFPTSSLFLCVLRNPVSYHF